MSLNVLLHEHRSAIVSQWFEMVVGTYHEETRGPLRRPNAPFTNPVGFNTAQGLEGLFDGLLKGMMPSETSRFLDGIVRIRAVQEFAPSEALRFIVQLKDVVRKVLATSTYKVDFYLWFRYRPNEQDKEFMPEDFVFTNAEGEWEAVPLREELNSDGTFLKTYRVSGVFKNQFQFYEYPFDHQSLIVEFRNQNANTSFIQYVVDQIGMRYEDEQALLENFRNNGAFESIYRWGVREVQVTQDIFPTFSTFGSPQNFDRKVATNYSLINVNVDLQRSSLQYIIKSLLSLLITLVLAYITFFLPLGHSERLAVGSTALLTTAFFHLTLADSLPEIGYTVAMEYLFYASYVMSALIVLLETLSIRYEKFGEDAKEESKKEFFEAQRVKF